MYLQYLSLRGYSICCRSYAPLWQALPTALTTQMKQANPISGYELFKKNKKINKKKDVKSNVDIISRTREVIPS